VVLIDFDLAVEHVFGVDQLCRGVVAAAVVVALEAY
jgi:hypothetical protein